MSKYIIVLSVLALFAIGCSRGNTDVSVTGEDGSKVTISGKDGQANVSGVDKDGGKFSASMGANTTFTEAELGVPFYPGSVEHANEQMKADTSGEKDLMCVRSTSDDPSKVADFYKDKVKGGGPQSMKMPGSNMVILSGNLDSGAKFSLTAERKDGAPDTMIRIGIVVKK